MMMIRPFVISHVASLMMVVTMLAVPAVHANVVLTPVKDTYINSGAKSTNYGSGTTMVTNWNSTSRRYAIFSFDLSTVAEAVTGVKLELRDALGNAGTKSYQIFGLLDAHDGWVESTLTWNDAGFISLGALDPAATYGAEPLGVFNTAQNADFTAFDVTSGPHIDFLNANRAETGGNTIVTYIIEDPENDSSGTGWATKESSNLKPTLTISTSVVPPDITPPTVLSITNDRSSEPVYINTPVNYTVTFSEAMASASITAADFGNAGSAAFSIDQVVVMTSSVFKITVTPSSLGTLQLEILAGALLKDLADNALDTSTAIAAPEVIDVVETPLVQRIRAFLLGGQSNADGRAAASGLPTSPVNLQQPQPDVDFYYKVEGKTAALTTLRPGLSETNAFGPDVTFGRRLADALGDGAHTRVAIIKYANGGTNLHTQWKGGGDNTTTGDGSEYKIFQQTVTGGLAALGAKYPGAVIEIEGMLWVQGESDNSEANAAAYQTNLSNFITDIRATYGVNLWFVVSRLSNLQTGVGTELETIRTAQTNVANADPLTALLNTDDFGKGDNLHFNATGYQKLGKGAADLLLGFRPFTSAPEVSMQAGGTLKVAVSKAFPDFRYTLRSSASLQPDSWEFEESITAASKEIEFTVIPDPLEPQKFYRVERTPAP